MKATLALALYDLFQYSEPAFMQFSLSGSQFLISGKDGRQVQLGQVPSRGAVSCCFSNWQQKQLLVRPGLLLPEHLERACALWEWAGSRPTGTAPILAFPCLCFRSFCLSFSLAFLAGGIQYYYLSYSTFIFLT